VQACVRQVATYIEIARIDNPRVTLPKDCTHRYSIGGYDTTPVTTLACCTVTLDAAGKYQIEARTTLGNTGSMGPL